MRLAFALIGGIALINLSGCQTSNANSKGNFGPRGTTPPADPCKVPSGYKGTGKGPGQFGGWHKYVSDAPSARASRAFNLMLQDGSAVPLTPPDPMLLLKWGGGGGDGNPC